MPYNEPTGHLQYYTMDSAPKDGTVVMALCQRKYPEAVYYASDRWNYWHLAAGTACAPDYWCHLPASAPSEYAQADVATPT